MKKNQLKIKRIKTGKVTIVNIKNNKVYNRWNTDYLYCGCTGNTVESATPMEYDGHEIYCPNCHEHKVEIIETYEEYLNRKDLENQEKLKNLKLICAGEDWECGLKFYKLSAKLEYHDWLKIKKYFKFRSPGWSEIEELEWYFYEPTGWLTRNGYTVQKILYDEGLISKENLIEFEDYEKIGNMS